MPAACARGIDEGAPLEFGERHVPSAASRPFSYRYSGTCPLARIFQLKGTWSGLTRLFSQMLVVQLVVRLL